MRAISQIKAEIKYNKNHRELKRMGSKKRRDFIRKMIIEYYSNGTMICACCNESEYDFLTIDHINNDGAKHRKIIGSNGGALKEWIVRNNFPEGFQILCMNCNLSKSKHGKCIHSIKK